MIDQRSDAGLRMFRAFGKGLNRRIGLLAHDLTVGKDETFLELVSIPTASRSVFDWWTVRIRCERCSKRLYRSLNHSLARNYRAELCSLFLIGRWIGRNVLLRTLHCGNNFAEYLIQRLPRFRVQRIHP